MRTIILLFSALLISSCANNEKTLSYEHELFMLESGRQNAELISKLNLELERHLGIFDSITNEQLNNSLLYIDKAIHELLMKSGISKNNFDENHRYKGNYYNFLNKSLDNCKEILEVQFPDFKNQVNQYPDYLSNNGIKVSFKLFDATDYPIYAADASVHAPTIFDLAFANKNLLQTLSTLYQMKIGILMNQREYVQTKMIKI